MRTGELAKLAGVTPRTLRHYRSIGLLPESERDTNGYCNYQPTDLIRLLRIKHLASLGFSLDTIGEMLASPDQVSGKNAQARLDELDHELALQIEELERQRHTIALLKQDNFDVDLPLEAASLVHLMRKGGMTEKLIDNEREAFLLADAFLDRSDTERLVAFYQSSDTHELLEHYGTLSHYIYTLPSETSSQKRDELANELATLFEPLIKALGADAAEEYRSAYEESPVESLVLSHEINALNDAQKDITMRALQKLSETFPAFKDIEKRFLNHA